MKLSDYQRQVLEWVKSGHVTSHQYDFSPTAYSFNNGHRDYWKIREPTMEKLLKMQLVRKRPLIKGSMTSYRIELTDLGRKALAGDA